MKTIIKKIESCSEIVPLGYNRMDRADRKAYMRSIINLLESKDGLKKAVSDTLNKCDDMFLSRGIREAAQFCYCIIQKYFNSKEKDGKTNNTK